MWVFCCDILQNVIPENLTGSFGSPFFLLTWVEAEDDVFKGML